MPLNLAVEYRTEIEQVAGATGVPVDVIVDLLNLEYRHQNLHGWGARPQLRRDMAEIVNRALASQNAPKGRRA